MPELCWAGASGYAPFAKILDELGRWHVFAISSAVVKPLDALLLREAFRWTFEPRKVDDHHLPPFFVAGGRQVAHSVHGTLAQSNSQCSRRTISFFRVRTWIAHLADPDDAL